MQSAQGRCDRCGRDLVGSSCPSCDTVAFARTQSSLEVLEGKWALERELGRGGMGEVWLAQDLTLGRPVAIKLLAARIADDAGLVARFEREARMMARLDHPNLVPVYAVGRHGERPFIVMKFLEGESLAELLQRTPRLAPDDVRLVVAQMCAGLQFVHGRGVIHRDLKPGNVFISPEGHVTLLDLGVARDTNNKMTVTGVIMGTPRYMAPEQILGKPIDFRIDLYALALVTFELATGRHPFADFPSDFEILRAHVEQAPPDASQLVDLPPRLGEVLARGLAKAPDERFQSAAEFGRAVEDALGSARPTRLLARPAPAPTAPAVPRPQTPARAVAPERLATPARPPSRPLPPVEDPAPPPPKRWWPLAAGVAVVAVASGGLLLWHKGDDPALPDAPKARPEAPRAAAPKNDAPPRTEAGAPEGTAARTDDRAGDAQAATTGNAPAPRASAATASPDEGSDARAVDPKSARAGTGAGPHDPHDPESAVRGAHATTDRASKQKGAQRGTSAEPHPSDSSEWNSLPASSSAVPPPPPPPPSAEQTPAPAPSASPGPRPRRAAFDGKLLTEAQTTRYYAARDQGVDHAAALRAALQESPTPAQAGPTAGSKRVAYDGHLFDEQEVARYQQLRAKGLSHEAAAREVLGLAASPPKPAEPAAAPATSAATLTGRPANLPKRIAVDGRLLSPEETEAYYRQKYHDK